MTTADAQLTKAGKPESEAARKPADVRFAQGDASLRKSTIMIIDDEPINVTVAQKYLSLAGYENFVTTSEPTEAIAPGVCETARRHSVGHHDAANQRAGHSRCPACRSRIGGVFR